jgi:hypothetical protein
VTRCARDFRTAAFQSINSPQERQAIRAGQQALIGLPEVRQAGTLSWVRGWQKRKGVLLHSSHKRCYHCREAEQEMASQTNRVQ